MSEAEAVAVVALFAAMSHLNAVLYALLSNNLGKGALLLYAQYKEQLHNDIIPSLIVVDCGPLDNPQNGFVRLFSTLQGATATYTCQPGFDLIGNRLRTCQANGQWSGQDPICRRQSMTTNDYKVTYYVIILVGSCGQLPNPPNGDVTLTGTTEGSLAVYTCRRGFTLVGNRQRSCQANGQWSGNQPICRRSELQYCSCKMK